MSDARCAKCGHPRSNHPYRHQFVGPSKDDTIKELEAKLAVAVGALEDALNRMEEDRASGDCGNWDWVDGDVYSRGRAALAEINGEK